MLDAEALKIGDAAGVVCGKVGDAVAVVGHGELAAQSEPFLGSKSDRRASQTGPARVEP